MERFVFDEKKEFLEKLSELVESGVPKRKINTLTPYPVHEAEHLLDPSPSPIRLFTVVGSLTGIVAGYWFTSYTALSWPMITGGKPFISIPAFTVIAYEMTILFGVLATFAGFLFLSRSPAIRSIVSSKEEFSEKFEIEVDR